jgi:hypothetical protein
MKTAESIDHNRKHRKLPSRKDGFAGGKVDPRAASSLANASRWSKDRRTVVALAQEARPEAWAPGGAGIRGEQIVPPTRLRAGELILAYSDGKPRQSVDVSIGGPREMNTLTRVELEALARGVPPPFQLAHNGNVIEGEVLSSGAAGDEPVARSATKRSYAAGKQACATA